MSWLDLSQLVNSCCLEAERHVSHLTTVADLTAERHASRLTTVSDLMSISTNLVVSVATAAVGLVVLLTAVACRHLHWRLHWLLIQLLPLSLPAARKFHCCRQPVTETVAVQCQRPADAVVA